MTLELLDSLPSDWARVGAYPTENQLSPTSYRISFHFISFQTPFFHFNPSNMEPVFGTNEHSQIGS
jgi:hypothetical protein